VIEDYCQSFLLGSIVTVFSVIGCKSHHIMSALRWFALVCASLHNQCDELQISVMAVVEYMPACCA
jgi:glycerol-3-phosphate responsive antiterminator